jgi:type VI protein secretion system component Hcp
VNGTNGAKGDTGAQGPAGNACTKPVLIGMIQIGSDSTPIYQVKSGVIAAGAIGGGKVVFSPFEVLKAIDASSPNLFKHCVKGDHLPMVTITINATSTSPAEVFELDDAAISSYNVAPSCETVLESVKIDFSRIRVTVGGTTSCFDLRTNTIC